MALSLQAKRVQAARTTLVLDEPFWGILALQLDVVEDVTCDTAWTNGKALGYSPAYIATINDRELLGLICHEVLHCACGHPWRRGSRDHRKFNEACDLAIYKIIHDAGMILPKGALHDPQFDGQYAEWIYDRLPQGGQDGQDPNGQPGGQDPNGTPDPNGKPDPNAQPVPGEVRDAPTGEGAPTEADWKETLTQATKIAEAFGKLPGGMARSINDASAPATDWRSALRRYVQDTCQADYTWTRPNARYLASGLFLPSLRSVQCGRIVVAVDTSGSINDVVLSQFAAELQAIAEDVQPASIDVVYCDTEVNGTATFERGDVVTLTPHGGGGTSFGPVFDHVDADGTAPAVLVYLTDLYGSFPDVAPDYPVLWAVTGRRNADLDVPFGDVLPID
jgi:predicted metal-dependent peptidase